MRLLGTSRSRTAGYPPLFVIIMLMYSLLDLPPSTSAAASDDVSASGYHRLRQRAHRRRHKQKLPVDQLADLFEMKAAAEEEVAHPRAVKNTGRRERNEDLCLSERRSVELNSDQYEFDPPFIVESCVHGLLRCVQRYAEVQTVRRPLHSTGWQPHLLRSVPSGCDCMWPVDKYGHQDL